MNDLFASDWVYEHNAENTERYVLGVKGKYPLICIGLNPSTATPSKLDPTLRLVSRCASRWGFDGWLMLNLCALRSTDPKNLPARLDCMTSAWHTNLAVIDRIVMSARVIVGKHPQGSGRVWLAWGCHVHDRPYLWATCEMVKAYLNLAGVHPMAHAVTKDGHPRHPLYMPGDSILKPFDLHEYVRAGNEARRKQVP